MHIKNIVNLLLGVFILLNFISCQTKRVINTTSYANLTSDKKIEVDSYLLDAKKLVIKEENEIVLLFQYNCFLGQEITINDVYKKDFPNVSKIHYGQTIMNFAKGLDKIKIKISNGKIFSIAQKMGYDYINLCYNEKLETFYIHYYDFPKMLVEE